MAVYGFNVSNTIPIEDEITFAQNNDFSILQLWFDRYGLSTKDKKSIDALVGSKIETVLHVAANIGEFGKLIASAVPVVKMLNHKRIIIHPTIPTKDIGTDLHSQLISETNNILPQLLDLGLKVYFENNSKLDPLFQTINDIDSFFNTFPQVEFLIDVAHMDSYEYLDLLTKVKMPHILHVSDRHLETIHEHLTIGDGNIDFHNVFKNHLKGFDGSIIFEVPWTDLARSKSKQLIQSILSI